MYVSGVWRGFWEQQCHGKQEMRAFELHFARGKVRGGGVDLVGEFTVTGAYDPRTGRVTLVKKYAGKHRVEYTGDPDGEGNIGGTWLVTTEFAGRQYTDRGPFVLRPELPRPTGAEPIHEIRPG